MQDETGASAILAEQLDASMGGRPQEHREVQGEESSAFQSVSAYLPSAFLSVFFPATGVLNRQVEQLEVLVLLSNETGGAAGAGTPAWIEGRACIRLS